MTIIIIIIKITSIIFVAAAVKPIIHFITSVAKLVGV